MKTASPIVLQMMHSLINDWYAQLLSHVQLFTTPWTVAHQAPLSVEFFRQEY